jgi:uncharacterized protein
MRMDNCSITTAKSLVIALGLASIGGAVEAAPSFDCSKVEAGSIEALICQDDQLSALDWKMAVVFAAAMKKASNEHPPVLKAEQRGWIKGRNDCWKSDDKRRCIEQSYKLRIAELQARYRLVQATKPVSYVCDGQPAKEVIATFFQTEPPTAIAEFGDQTSLMYQQPAASGVKYQGRNETLWEHQGEARITWGYGSPEMHCRVQR